MYRVICHHAMGMLWILCSDVLLLPRREVVILNTSPLVPPVWGEEERLLSCATLSDGETAKLLPQAERTGD